MTLIGFIPNLSSADELYQLWMLHIHHETYFRFIPRLFASLIDGLFQRDSLILDLDPFLSAALFEPSQLSLPDFSLEHQVISTARTE